MKNVLLTTTALVVLAGAASAGSHTGVSFGGSADMSYNSITGFSTSSALAITAAAELNNGVTATLTYGLAIASGNPAANVKGDEWPVITLASGMGTLTAGDADAVGAATSHYAAVGDAGDFGTGNYTSSNFAVRADVALGGFAVSASTVVVGGSDLRVGASGSVGSVAVGVGVDGASNFGLNASTTVAGAAISGAYFSDGSYGLSVAYAVSDAMGVTLGYGSTGTASVGVTYQVSAAMGVSAAYATDGTYSVGVDYTSGAMGVSVGVNETLAVAIDATYDIGSGVMAYAGYDSGSAVSYLGVSVDLGAGASASASYANGALAGPNEYADGITVGVAMVF